MVRQVILDIATLGGNAATNAGGNRVIRYGMMRDMVLGLEGVLADGTVVSSMNHLIKNNAGYDLKQLFIGSEGTLGVITRLVLRLREQPVTRNMAFVGLENFDPIGRYRTENNGKPVDSAGELPTGDKFTGPLELRQVLMKEKEQFAYNMTERMLGYALGRGLEYYDLPTVESLRKELIADGYKVQTLIHGITQSFPFQFRRNDAIE